MFLSFFCIYLHSLVENVGREHSESMISEDILSDGIKSMWSFVEYLGFRNGSTSKMIPINFGEDLIVSYE
jgi:hypothetical protein